MKKRSHFFKKKKSGEKKKERNVEIVDKTFDIPTPNKF